MKNKRVIALIALAAVFAISVFAGCDLGGKTTSTGTNDTEISYPAFESEKSTSDTSENDSAPAEKEQSSDAVNEEPAPESEPSAQESSKPSANEESTAEKIESSMTKEEIISYAMQQNGIEETSENIQNKTILYDDYIKEDPEMTAEKFTDIVRKSEAVWESTQKVYEKFVERYCEHYGVKRDAIETSDFKMNWFGCISPLENTFFGLDDNTYLEMLSLLLNDESIEPLIDPYSWKGFSYFMLFQQAKLSGQQFDSSKRLTADGIKSIIEQTQKIQDVNERLNYFNEKISQAQNYPDYVSQTSGYWFNWYCIGENKMDNENCVLLKRSGFSPESDPVSVSYSKTDENGKKLNYYYDFQTNVFEVKG